MSSTTAPANRQNVRSLVPARMDRLPWSRFHTLIVVGLGVSWILDGLEAQIVSQNGYATTLHMNAALIGWAGTIYLIGQVAGALVFGWLSDRLGRRKLFFLTLLIYLGGTLVAGLTLRASSGSGSSSSSGSSPGRASGASTPPSTRRSTS
ncbi:hypothetical protein GCM10025881_32160 [Pseudolysinimonas kribbensis]|uniref:Major facilitator superfamily (MFS) profile domain-containing protein n=1 Tax=Pseudolysinimonas kribbensis TaxID=433641 RepID=A0ABQ6KCS0_9MICO|nr:MFS transporter [Pseudolysinimonas kribbensis]GMA96392.1 hypothetical protein GCM10025881_32160 [Pseudolysinimonas kribbensis]